MATGGTVLVRAIAIDGDLEGEETFHIPVAVRSSRPKDDDGVDGGGGTDTPPTLRDFVDEAKPAMLALDIRQSSTEDFFSLVAALKAASAEAVVPQVTVGESTAALSMRLGGDLRLKGEGLSAVVEAVRASIGRPEATVTSAVKSVSFPTGRDLIAFVDTLKVDVGDPRTCVTQSGGGRA
jgi:hypothetical protein